jgi:very-short-patch-repair endonuclease
MEPIKMKCPKCSYEIRGGKIFDKHHSACDGSGPRSKKVRKPGGKALSRDLTKETDDTLMKISIAVSQALTGVNRESLSEEHRTKISKSMQQAHAENRAWNIGSSRWKNEPSYPEMFFIQVVENEFSDKNFMREYAVGRYSIDFAWVHLKLAIEIDGQQHEKEDQRLSDERKDMFRDPQHEIEKCKKFLGE